MDGSILRYKVANFRIDEDAKPGVAKVLKRLHYPLEVILTSVRWYVAYPLSLRQLEEMMAERGTSVDHRANRSVPL